MPHSDNDPTNRPMKESLTRQVTLWGLWVLAINGVIGAGIFGLPVKVAERAGSYSPLIFVLCGLVLLPIILSFAEISSYFRRTGGPVVYVREAFGPFAGFQAGWAYYVARVTSNAANANLLLGAIAHFWPVATTPVWRVLLLIVICGGFAVVNVIGAKQAIQSVGWLTVLKFIPLLLLAGLGIGYLAPPFPVSHETEPLMSHIGEVILVAIYAFVGWESALVPAGEAKKPSRDIPRALLITTALATLLYALIQAVTVSVLPNLTEIESERILVNVAEVMMGPVGAMVVLVGVVVSIIGNIAASTFSTPRITYAMALERWLPAWFGHVHPGYRTPTNSILFFGAVTLALAIYGNFAWLAGLSTVVRLGIYISCMATIPHLRRKYGDHPERFHLRSGYLFPVVGVALCCWLITYAQLQGILLALGWAGIGAVLYAVSSRVKPSSHEE